MTRMLSLLSVLLLVVTSDGFGGGGGSGNRPNIVVVLADDLGFGDLACYGHPVIRTPNLDSFADQGVRFTNCYSAAANCSPARAGLMTGRTPYRVGIYNWIPMLSPMHLKASEQTIASTLRRDGYTTCHVGKWHLNGRFNLGGQPQPSDHGFDHWFATQNNALPNHSNPDNFVRNGAAVGKLTGYAGHLVASEAIEWLANGRDKAKPFFLFVCFHEPHEPIASDRRYRDLYPPAATSRANHHGNVTQMDTAFGELMAALDRLELADDTFVWFTSDNGPAITRAHPHGSPGGLRMKKGHLYEGGIRVPGILRWPGRVKPGTTIAEPVSGVDVYPTLCEVAGVATGGERLDGTSWLGVLDGGQLRRARPLYWQFQYTRSTPHVAMRIGDWKVLGSLAGPAPQPTGHLVESDIENIKTCTLEGFELYNLRHDVGESLNLAKSEVERLETMVGKLREVHQDVQRQAPRWPAWEWPRYESKRIVPFLKTLAR